MYYILKTINLLDKIQVDYNLSYVEDSKYYSLINQINSNIVADYRDIFIEFLDSMEISKQINLINVYLHPEIIFDENVEYNYTYTLNDLNNDLLLKFLLLFFKSITFRQKDNLVLLHYSKLIFITGWHNLAIQCRGKVIDINTKNYVVYPFNKFFNLNENESTDLVRIKELINKASYINVTDKKDGTAIYVTKHNNSILINTNGELDNIYIDLARNLLMKKYSLFYNNIPEGYTFIFELITPETRVILDYGNEKALYLLAVRDLNTLKFKLYPELQELSIKFNLDLVAQFEFESIEKLMDIAANTTENIKEGWVIRIVSDTEDMMFKLKYSEYFLLARLKAESTSLRRLYLLIKENKLDDVLAIMDNTLKEEIQNKINIIYSYLDKIQFYVKENINRIRKTYNIENEIITIDDIKLIVEKEEGNLFFDYILKVMKGVYTLDNILLKLPSFKKFRNIYDYINQMENLVPEEFI